MPSSGAQFGGLKYFLNTGTTTAPVFVQQTGEANPLAGVNPSTPGWMTPTFADLDGDGDRDLILGENDGHLFYFQNTGSAATPVFAQQTGAGNPFDDVDVGNLSAPTFADLDDDGDFDAVVGAEGGGFTYLKNIGTVTEPLFVQQTGSNNPFEGMNAGGSGRTTPNFVDLDGDGDFDVIVGTSASGTVQYFMNTGTASAPVFTQQTGANNPFSGISLGFDLLPAAGDINGDGRPDVVVGEGDGTLNFLLNTPPTGIPITVNVTAQNDAPDLMPNSPAGVTFTENMNGILQLIPLGAIADPDNPVNFAGGSINVAISGAVSGDRLSLLTPGPGNVSFTNSGGVLTVTVAGMAVGTISGLATANMTITLNPNATDTAVEALLHSLVFDTISENPTSQPRNAVITFSDGGNSGVGAALTDSVTVPITVVPVNDAPVIFGSSVSFSILEPDDGSPTLSPDLSVTDVDNPTLSGATVRISAGTFAGAGDVLAATTSGTSITASYNGATGTLSLSGSDTLAHYQQVLRTVSFHSTSSNPDNSGVNPTRTIEWQLNDSTASGVTRVDYAAGGTPAGVAIGDFDGDARPDLAVANNGSNSVSVLLNNGDGTFAPATNFAIGAGQFAVATADLNGDGRLDLVTASQATNNVSVLFGNGDGTFGAATHFGAGGFPASIAIADLNGNGALDLAVANESGTVSVLLGNGSGGFAPATHYTAAPGTISVAIGDLNGDSRLDLATANLGSNTVSVLLGTGGGSFAAATSLIAGTHPISVAMGDLNGDNKLDLAIANQSSNNISVLLGNGDGSFAAATNFAVGTTPQSVAIGTSTVTAGST